MERVSLGTSDDDDGDDDGVGGSQTGAKGG